MTEHEVCKDCSYNHYPLCYGTIMFDGNYMNIENLREGFECGQKDKEMTDFSIVKKTDLELKIDVLELRIKDLEVK